MALYPKLAERPSRDVETGHVYVLVDFYPTLRDRQNGTNRVLREEFIMQLSPTRLFPTTDPVTGKTSIVEVPVDFRAELRANVQRFIATHDAKGTRGDLTGAARGRPRLRDNVDTTGMLAALANEELP
jgi:hypothetical protein